MATELFYTRIVQRNTYRWHHCLALLEGLGQRAAPGGLQKARKKKSLCPETLLSLGQLTFFYSPVRCGPILACTGYKPAFLFREESDLLIMWARLKWGSNCGKFSLLLQYVIFLNNTLPSRRSTSLVIEENYFISKKKVLQGKNVDTRLIVSTDS